MPAAWAVRSSQRGVAALVVVGMLFLVISLAAAYTNRNLIFETRTAANTHRAVQAHEVAEAGLEWALSMLNAGRLDASCAATSDTAQGTFSQRYLITNTSTGVVDPRANQASDVKSWPSCFFNAETRSWSCSCPATGASSLTVPSQPAQYPAFRVRFRVENAVTPRRPGLVWVDVNGCTRPDGACLDFPSSGLAGEGRASVTTLVALRSGLSFEPTSAVTARGSVSVASGQVVRITNPSQGSSGLAIWSGGTAPPDASMQLIGRPGTPGVSAVMVVAGDAAALSPPSGQADPARRFFGSLYGATPANFRDQPGAIVLDCSTTSCDSGRFAELVLRNPGRPFWVKGDLTIASGTTVGSVASPVLLFMDRGALTVNGTFFGVVHGTHTDSEPTSVAPAERSVQIGGSGTIQGALISDNGIFFTGPVGVTHDVAVFSALRWQTGSYVRVPGSWRDFQ